ncbi:hypothetical protein AMTRI_Chr01g126260 [Amborella trichopoda]
MSSLCPFANLSRSKDVCPRKIEEKHYEHRVRQSNQGNKEESEAPNTVSPKCPFGYDSHAFKLGPLSCVICRALLFETSKCLPCSHKYCKVCISRFKDCPICGADIERIEPEPDLQDVVDHFIEGHARIKRSTVNSDIKGVTENDQVKSVVYEDVSLERGTFLVQQAMRAFQAQNLKSAESRLSLCTEDIRDQIERSGCTSELCSQLGAVVHTLSVSLNKIGDLKYYDGDLSIARSYYSRSLEVRQNALKSHSNISSQMVDIAVSLAKVADVDRSLGNEGMAINGFQEAIKCLESLKLDANEVALEKRRLSVLEFLHGQLAERENLLAPPTA